MKNPRDSRAIQVLASQMRPNNSKFVTSAYKDCTKNPYSYLFIDLSQQQNDLFRSRTNIFPDDNENHDIIYSEK